MCYIRKLNSCKWLIDFPDSIQKTLYLVEICALVLD